MREQKSWNRIDEKRKKNDELMMKNDEVNDKIFIVS